MAFQTGVNTKLDVYYLGNSGGKQRLYRWEYEIKTNDINYLTSNTPSNWAFSFKYKDANSSNYITVSELTQTGSLIVNTDINDKIIISGVMEVDTAHFHNQYGRFNFSLSLENIIQVNTYTETGKQLSGSDSPYITNVKTGESSYYNQSASFLTFDNFTDEDNGSFTYEGVKLTSSINIINAVISFDGYTRNIQRTLPRVVGGVNQAAFNFTDAERTVIRKELVNVKSKEVYIFLESLINSSWEGTYIGHPYSNAAIGNGYCGVYIKRTISIVNGEPVFSPVIKDTNATTIALTGNESKLVKYYSNAYVASNVAAQKEASIVSHKITLGSKSTTARTYTFNGVESNKYVFTAIDSRGFSTIKEVSPPFVDYVKLTCAVDNEPIGTISGTMKITIHGNYYDGSFGAVDNNLGLTYRCRVKGTEWGNWVNVSNPSTYGETYSVNVVVSGLNYKNTYELQAMATDRLNSISTVVYTITTVPTFDWSRNDFNFSVPVALQDNLEVKGDTTLNGALGVEGVANFSNFTNFDGLTSFAYTPTFTNGLEIDMANTTFDSNTMADYVIETGTEAMGSNGTWKWQKWASGKAEAWGKRNYGNMGFPNEYVVGAMYVSGSNMAYTLMWQSDTFTQDLPSIFSEEPDVIDINIIKSNGNAFIIRGLDTGASASSTGGFAICKNNSTNMSAVHLGFHVVGTWKSEE